ncbi:hypothetical protein ACHAW5_007240 [Stephanodiscus triporus]|uniref:glycerol-3-phosphate dehydrogenase n=1 Tax=Stephanodiscus triporus TaxID=2934178 RepID=A0ABD3NTZ6_9STRA
MMAEELGWMLKECEKYLSKDLKVRRSDVLSAWGRSAGSRDIHESPDRNDREMARTCSIGCWARDARCNTLDIVLHGNEGYSKSLSIQLIQKYGLTPDVAEVGRSSLCTPFSFPSPPFFRRLIPSTATHPLLSVAFGDAVKSPASCRNPADECGSCSPTPSRQGSSGQVRHEARVNYPYIGEEVRYACQEYACTIEDDAIASDASRSSTARQRSRRCRSGRHNGRGAGVESQRVKERRSMRLGPT